MTTHRTPYVGTGEDGARRCAERERDQARDLSWSDPRRQELEDSIEQWEKQATELMRERMGPKPTLEKVRDSTGNERVLAALALLLKVCPAPLGRDAARFTDWDTVAGTFTYEGEGEDKVCTFHPAAGIDWDAWVADVDERGRGWSSTESRLFEVVAALVVDDRKLALTRVLDYMGSWETDVWRVLVEWGTGGNNRELPGRATVVARA
jgi:hypothetical protein